VLNEGGDELATVLEQLARLSGDAADVLEANRPFLETAVTEGGKTLDVLDRNRARLKPLVTGLRQFFQVLSEAGRIPRSDGTVMAAIKLVFGESCPTGRIDCGEVDAPPASASAGAAAFGPTPPLAGPLPAPKTGVQGLVDLIGGLLP
jgi:ABC-type transporter Mla subunit MlaD